MQDDIDPLTRLAIRHGTDKWGLHFYTPIYHDLFEKRREQPVRLLEIGIGGYGSKVLGGASLAMWADYFPNGRIVGIDIAAKTLALNPRITTLQGSQDDRTFLTYVMNAHGPFDIVIDDGSHQPTHVVASFSCLFPRMAEGGLYVIEDVQTAFMSDFGGSPEGSATFHLAHTILESLNDADIRATHPERPIDQMAAHVRSFRAYQNLLVIERGDNNAPSSMDYKRDNPRAAAAIDLIERELRATPTPEGFANLIDVYSKATDHMAAMSASTAALARWPEHPTLLFAAFGASSRANDRERALEYLQRFSKIDDQIAGPLLLRLRG